MNPRAPLLLAATLLLGCGDTEPEASKADDPCPHISMESLPGRWIKYDKKADQTWRFEVVSQGEASGGPEMWLTAGGWTKKQLAGERRSSDWSFTEIPDDRKKAAYEAGNEGLIRLYVESNKAKCALRVSEVEVMLADGVQKERPKPGFVEYVEFPKQYDFTFRPCDSDLFFGAAANDRKAADKQLAELKMADPSSPLGEALSVAAWTPVEKDGDAACTFDMDLYFDDQPAKDKAGQPRGPLPAAAPVDGWRQWLVSYWYAPFSGNHHFQIYRYRACNGGERELIGVSCTEAVLQ